MRDWIFIRPTMRLIAEQAAHDNGLTLAEIRTPVRLRRIAWPRQKAMAAMYATGRWSNKQIVSYFNLQDHTSCVHARRAVSARSLTKQGAA